MTEQDTKDNEVKVGTKDINAYSQAIQTQALQGEREIIVMARGMCIQKAVDVVEIFLHKFPDWHKKSVDTGTHDRQHQDEARDARVSYIKITIQKQPMAPGDEPCKSNDQQPTKSH